MFLFALVRALHFASLLVLFGASAFAWIVRARLQRELPIPRWLWLLCGVGAFMTPLLLVGFVAGEMAGTPNQFDPSSAYLVLRNTLYGHVAVLRMVVLSILLVIALFKRDLIVRAGTWLSGIALALLGLTSHAAAAGTQHFGYLRAAVDSAHLLTAGFWTGGLVALLFVVIGQSRDTELHIALLRLFSRWAMPSVVLLVAAGTLNSIAILDVQGMRWSSVYLGWLAAKLALAGLMIALALTNRFGVLPGLVTGDKEAQETIPLTLIAELASALLIIIIVGFLGITAPMQM